MADKIYVDDIGHIILADAQCDISTATKASLIVAKPDDYDVEYEWVGTAYSEAKADYIADTGYDESEEGTLPDPCTRRIRYVTIAGDFNDIGNFKCQGYVELSGGAKLRGETFIIKISEKFK